MTIYTDFAAQSALHSQDAQCCGTDAHCNKAIFVTQRDARTVEVETKAADGGTTNKRVHTTDVWTVFFPASAKYKDNDYLAHWKSLEHIVDHYVKLREEEGKPPLKRIFIYTDGAPGQCKSLVSTILLWPF